MGNKISKVAKHLTRRNPADNNTSLDESSKKQFHCGSLPIREDNRYRASSLLKSNGIPNAIWLQDLLASYGRETVLQDVNLLVQDPLGAASCLTRFGYRRIAPEARFQRYNYFAERCVRVAGSGSTGTAVVLMPAPDWFYGMQTQSQNPMPPLHSFLDSAIGFWLNISSKDYIERLEFALYIAEFIYDCYALTDGDGIKVKTVDYAERLKPEHRELHYDIVAGKQEFTHTARHRYHAQKYREIKAGLFAPVPYQKDGYRPQLGTLSE